MSVVSDDYAFLRVNGRTYTVTEVAVPTVDALMTTMQDLHERRVHAQTEALRQEFVREAFELSNNELSELVRIAQQNQVAIPNERAAYPLVSLSNTLCPVRSVIYSPSKIEGTLSGWHSCIPQMEFWSWVTEHAGYDVFAGLDSSEYVHHKMIVTGKCSKQAVTLYTILNDSILCTCLGPHTVGRSFSTLNNHIEWHKCCIGNTPAAQYWTLPTHEFLAAINSINLDSVARTGVYFSTSEPLIELYDLIMHYMTDVQIKHIRPTEGWEVPSA